MSANTREEGAANPNINAAFRACEEAMKQPSQPPISHAILHNALLRLTAQADRAVRAWKAGEDIDAAMNKLNDHLVVVREFLTHPISITQAKSTVYLENEGAK